MDNRIPDFGRGSVDQADKLLQNFFKKKEKEHDEQKAVLHAATDRLDLSGALDAVPDKKKWTVLLYMDGNNNLFVPMFDALKSLEGVGSNNDVNIVAEIGGNPGDKGHGGILETIMNTTMKDKKIETVRRYYVTKDNSESPQIKSPKLADLGEQDMGDPKVVSDFLEWGIKKFPAEHYAIIFFNHGAGFAGSLSDEKSGNLVDTAEMKEVVDKAAQAAGKKIDLVDFDACLMAQVEVAHALKDGASYMVASEETERGSAQPLAKVMKVLQEGSKDLPMSPEDLAKLFVYESFYQTGSEMFTTTLSAVDLAKIDKVTASTDALAKAIMGDKDEHKQIRKDAAKSENYCQGLNYKLYNDYHDVGHFAKILQQDAKIQDENVKKAARELLDALGSAVIAVEHQGKGYTESTGLSTYLPTNYGFDPAPKTDSVNFSSTHNYEGIPYAKETGWDDMVKDIARDSSWHNLLRTFGMSKEGIDTLDRRLSTVGNTAIGISKTILGAGKLGAHYEAYQALRHGMPKSYLWLGSELSTQLGMLGGAYKAFQGVSDLYKASQDRPPEGITDVLFDKKTKMVNASLNTAEGAALVAVNAALLMGASAGIKTTAGLLSFALPVAKVIYDGIAVPKNLKKKAEEMQQPSPADGKTVQQKLQEIEQNKGHFVK
ncbi:MAG: clostripain-related cysteine peptidase [Candidatus Eremiobacteraeota bacterium]|nr:clostripain-related cysteine peptidase [Candidatus Eremiobacteraeota bacterium]